MNLNFQAVQNLILVDPNVGCGMLSCDHPIAGIRDSGSIGAVGIGNDETEISLLGDRPSDVKDELLAAPRHDADRGGHRVSRLSGADDPGALNVLENFKVWDPVIEDIHETVGRFINQSKMS